jgi:aminopeptidase N
MRGLRRLGLAALIAAAPAGADPRDFDDADVARAIEHVHAPPADDARPDTSGYDVRKYTLRYDLDFDARTIQADTVIDAVATGGGLKSVTLDFTGFDISALSVDGAPAAWQRTGGKLEVTLPHALAAGAAFSIDVGFAGAPQTLHGLGLRFTHDGAWTLAEPSGAHQWFPCKDLPSDKATYEGFITVPASITVASNGALVEVTHAGGRRTFHWREDHPIATYLVSLAAGDYRVIEDHYGEIPVRHWVFADVEDAAREDFGRVPEMMDLYSTRFGVPFPFDKYGHALARQYGSAMEHQSCTTYGARVVTGDRRYERVVAHELGHQWFGDLVTPASWDEIWLNEGFATWTEFFWTEHVDPAFVPELMAKRETRYLDAERRDGAYALYAPSHAQLFGTTIYQKGGWVVAMLRYVIGEDAFFAGLKSYLDDNAGGNSTTPKLEAAMEQASGRDLSAFFAQWVYGAGHPVYKTSWSAHAAPGGRTQVDVRIRQTQAGAAYTIPLEIDATAADSSHLRQRVDVPTADTIVSLCLDFAPASVVVDPDNRILGTVTATGRTVPPQPAICP